MTEKTIEIRIHGRGGQGSVTAAELLAVAAFDDGWYSQAFPMFGVERRGAPVFAFTRMRKHPIKLRSQIYEPDYVIVQDATLIDVVDVASGTNAGSLIIINSEKEPEQFNLDAECRVVTVDATGIAMDVIGRPIVNTTLLGAFAGLTGGIDVECIKNAVKARFSGKIGETNAEAVRKAYEMTGGAS